jgi:hypothetical protein
MAGLLGQKWEFAVRPQSPRLLRARRPRWHSPEPVARLPVRLLVLVAVINGIAGACSSS